MSTRPDGDPPARREVGEDAAEALLAAVGNDLRELVAACSQLVADTGGRIDVPTVARYYKGRAEVSGFTVADAAMVGDVPAALEALRWALHIGVDPVRSPMPSPTGYELSRGSRPPGGVVRSN